MWDTCSSALGLAHARRRGGCRGRGRGRGGEAAEAWPLQQESRGSGVMECTMLGLMEVKCEINFYFLIQFREDRVDVDSVLSIAAGESFS